MDKNIYKQGVRYGLFNPIRMPSGQAWRGIDDRKIPVSIDRQFTVFTAASGWASGEKWNYTVPLLKRATLIHASVYATRTAAVAIPIIVRIGIRRKIFPFVNISAPDPNVQWVAYIHIAAGTLGASDKDSLKSPVDLFAGDSVLAYAEESPPGQASFITANMSALEFDV